METGNIELAKEDFRTAAMTAGIKQGKDPKAWRFGGYVSLSLSFSLKRYSFPLADTFPVAFNANLRVDSKTMS
jgi:hypothetical protein